jgi:hypothetical protein
MSTNSGTLPEKALAGYSDNNSGRFKTMLIFYNSVKLKMKHAREGEK